MRFRHHLITFSVLFILACSVQAADVNFPYARINLKLPPAQDPCPGLGNYYSALSYGLASVRWNPASLAKLKFAPAFRRPGTTPVFATRILILISTVTARGKIIHSKPNLRSR